MWPFLIKLKLFFVLNNSYLNIRFKHNKYSGLTIQLPFKQKGDGWILYWNEKRVQQLITGLNDGSIPFDTDGVTFRMNTPPELTITSKEHD